MCKLLFFSLADLCLQSDVIFVVISLHQLVFFFLLHALLNTSYSNQVRALQRRLEPHLLRRVKEDVATDIPAKEEVCVGVFR
jgi:hypothetical protein